MSIIEVVAGGIIAGITLVISKSYLDKRELNKDREEETLRKATLTYEKFWYDNCHLIEEADLRKTVKEYFFADNKELQAYSSMVLGNPATRAYYTHPNVRTAAEQAQVDATPDPILAADAEAVRLAMILRGNASLAVMASGVR